MKVICVDDERILVEDIARMCMELNEIDDVQSFVKAGDALAWIETIRSIWHFWISTCRG